MKKYKISICVVLLPCLFFVLYTSSVASATSHMQISVQTQDGNLLDLYEGSYALVVGNSEYTSQRWADSGNAVKDAEEVAKALIEHGFEVTLKRNLTAEEFEATLIHFLNSHGQREKNRLFFYYAGHGYSIENPFDPERKNGYLVMTDTPDPEKDKDGFDLRSISLESIEERAELLLAHHILFMFDSCFSGAILGTMRESKIDPQDITDNVRYPVRQFISSGEDGEKLPTNSVFKKVFLDLLKGEYSEVSKDGYLTGSELGQYLYQEVVNATDKRQHPQYGKSRSLKLQKGDFIFIVNPPEKRPFNCVTTKTEYPPVFPYSLINSKKSRDFPYWFYVTMDNKCDEDILFEISFDLLSGPAVISKDKKIGYKIERQKLFAQSVPFPVDFSRPDVDDVLVVTWIIRTSDDKTILDQGTADIVVLSRTQYCWDLINFDGKPVSRDFLFASLTAWSQSADAKLKELANELMEGVPKTHDRVSRARQWFEQCYAQFQNKENYTEITPIQRQFPPKTCWNIQTPMRVLEKGWGNPLEVSLLIGALMKKASVYERFGLQVVVFILPGPEDAKERQVFLLSWSTDGNNWKALNMAHANTMTFENNIQQATLQLTRLLEEERDILKILDEEGVFIEKERNIFALDFPKAAKKFRIRALP